MKKNKVLKSIGTTMLAGSIAFGSFTGAGLPQPVKVEASEYQQVNLKQGMRHQDVKQLKKDLAKSGFKVPGNGTTLFGKQTNKQVRAFQKYYSLTVDGVVGNQMKSKLNQVTKSPLQRGKRHKNTIQLKKDLARAGFKVPGKGTNLFGKQTERQVKAFQKKYKLVQNGIADSVTLQKLDTIANPTLENGVRHQDVKQLKKDLEKAGFKVPGNGTTLFGKQTEKQVKAFQKYYGLSQSGKVDNNTEKQIKAVVNSVLQNGKRHKDTVQLKKNLAAAGFKVPGKGTNLYGKQTERQVKAFQKQYKLVQNGIADNVTLKKLEQAANPTLENGIRHQDVKQLKKDLAKAGFKVPGKGTTLFGRQTEKQVKAFQKYYGLSQSGKVDSNTEKQIKSVVNSSLQSGKRHKDTIQLKKNLAIAGFTVPGNGTSLYGKQTEKQVKAFQKQYKLVQNGIADQVTLEKLQKVVEQINNNDDGNATEDEANRPFVNANNMFDKEPVDNKLTFNVEGKDINGKTLKPVVKHNGKTIDYNYPKVTINLVNGDNEIDLFVKDEKGRTATKGYNYYHLIEDDTEHLNPPTMDTDGLDESNIKNGKLTFTVKGQDDKGRNLAPEVTHNGKVVNAKNGKYTVDLIEGENKFTIKVVDAQGQSVSRAPTIYYEKKQDEPDTPTTKPTVTVNGLKDGMKVGADGKINFTASAKDAKGKSLPVTIYVQRAFEASTVDESNSGNYSFGLRKGMNAVLIEATDDYGNIGYEVYQLDYGYSDLIGNNKEVRSNSPGNTGKEFSTGREAEIWGNEQWNDPSSKWNDYSSWHSGIVFYGYYDKKGNFIETRRMYTVQFYK